MSDPQTTNDDPPVDRLRARRADARRAGGVRERTGPAAGLAEIEAIRETAELLTGELDRELARVEATAEPIGLDDERRASVLDTARGAIGEDPAGRRKEFLELVKLARKLKPVRGE